MSTRIQYELDEGYLDLHRRTTREANWGESLPILTGEDLAQLSAPDWLLEPYVPEEGLCVLFGEPGSGKSLVALGWALQVSQKTRFLGHQYDGYPYRALYLWGEGQTGIPLRVQAQVDYLMGGQMPNDQFAVMPVATPLVPNNEDAQEILRVVHDNGVRLVVIDTLQRYFDGDENSQQDMGEFVNFIQHFQQAGAAVIVVHHSPKGDKKDMRGSTVLRGAADVAIMMEKLGEMPNHHLVMHSVKDKEGGGFTPRELKFLKTTMEFEKMTNSGPITYTREAVTVGLNTGPVEQGGVDWASRFARYFDDLGMVSTKTSAAKGDEKMTGKAVDIRAAWADFEDRGWIVYSDEYEGYHWVGPEPAEEL